MACPEAGTVRGSSEKRITTDTTCLSAWTGRICAAWSAFSAAIRCKIALLMAYTGEPREIEDPWYTDRYDVVYDEVDAGCEALLNELEQERRIKGKHHG